MPYTSFPAKARDQAEGLAFFVPLTKGDHRGLTHSRHPLPQETRRSFLKASIPLPRGTKRLFLPVNCPVSKFPLSLE